MTVNHGSQTAESMEIASNSPLGPEMDPSLNRSNKLEPRATHTIITILLTKPDGTEIYNSKMSRFKVLTNLS